MRPSLRDGLHCGTGRQRGGSGALGEIAGLGRRISHPSGTKNCSPGALQPELGKQLEAWVLAGGCDVNHPCLAGSLPAPSGWSSSLLKVPSFRLVTDMRVAWLPLTVAQAAAFFPGLSSLLSER